MCIRDSNKINFKKVIMNKDYEATKEDLNYYKKSFESLLFDKDFISIFNLNNILLSLPNVFF